MQQFTWTRHLVTRGSNSYSLTGYTKESHTLFVITINGRLQHSIDPILVMSQYQISAVGGSKHEVKLHLSAPFTLRLTGMRVPAYIFFTCFSAFGTWQNTHRLTTVGVAITIKITASLMHVGSAFKKCNKTHFWYALLRVPETSKC